MQFANGPDGCLYVIDMYRELIEGAAFLPPQILKHLDVSSGVDRGRIYRIVAEDFKQPKPPRLGKATTAELVALLEHPNGWHRDTAARLLYQRQDQAAVASTRRSWRPGRSRRWAGCTPCTPWPGWAHWRPDSVLTALGDPEPRVREHALRLAEPLPARREDPGRLEQMSRRPRPAVRYQLAFSLGAVPGERPARRSPRWRERDGADPWFRLAILSSARTGPASCSSPGREDSSARRRTAALPGASPGRSAAAGQASDLAAGQGARLSGP